MPRNTRETAITIGAFDDGVRFERERTEHFWRETIARDLEYRQGRHLRHGGCERHQLDDAICKVCDTFDITIIAVRGK